MVSLHTDLIEEAKVEAPWYAAYPAPKSVPDSISASEVFHWLQDGKQPGKDFILVDLRRTDCEGGVIHGALNLPAQSLYPTIPSLHAIVSAANVKYVIWYCSSASSRGRGPRAAGWFADYLLEREDSTVASLVLEGGIKEWANSGPEYVRMMDGYEASAWQKESSLINVARP